MPNAFICDAIRTPIGRYGGALAHVRTDDLGAIPLRALLERNAKVDWSAVDDVIYGCANQAGEDNRNVRADGIAAGRAAGRRPWHDGESSMRIEHGRHRHRGARRSRAARPH
jgi:acetyl-CoA acetyltransferase